MEHIQSKNSSRIVIDVRVENFDVNEIMSAQRQDNYAIGAQVVFVGLVRDFVSEETKSSTDRESKATSMELEHYPAMTESVLHQIAQRVCQQWEIQALTVIHRIGRLDPGDQIVAVVVASKHRGQAFSACECMMDYLKTQAPFWKKETHGDAGSWVDARDSDQQSMQKWTHIFDK